MKKILTIGSATHDIFITIAHDEIISEQKNDSTFLLFEEGCKVEVKQLHHATGGGCSNASASLKLLGHTVLPVCKIAQDAAGDHVLADFQKRGISTEHVIITSQEPTGTSFILPSLTGNRVILAHRGANTTLEKGDIPLKTLEACDGVYVGPLAGVSAELLPHITEHAHKHNVLVAVNPGKGQLVNEAVTLKKALKHIDVFILNEREAKLLFAQLQPNTTFSIDAYFKELLQRGPKIVVVTCGAQGIHVATAEQRYFKEPFATIVRNTVGAGDAFASCFFGMLMHGKSVEDALSFGMRNSAALLTGRDAKEGLLRTEEFL